jgi:EAL domain-containing protein (putative c-di-GMP-specific phosphodiesterase class I)/ActR/RegA family two-component response regulator
MPPQIRSPHILLVDDDPPVREVYRRALQRYGFDITAVGNGESAILAMEGTSFDVVVTDIDMPQMNGIGLLERIRAQDLDVPVIFVTGLPSMETAIRSVSLGATRYLTKPVRLAELVEVVSEAVSLHGIARAKRDAWRLVGATDRFSADQAGLSSTFDRALHQLFVVYQPIVCWSSRSTYAYEALLRSRDRYLSTTASVIDAADRLGRFRDLGRIVRRAALEALDHLDPEIALFINLHPSDLFDDQLIAGIEANPDIAPGRIVFEITERAALKEFPGVQERVAILRRMGFRIAIDDVGAGYSGLTSFSLLQPDIAKLDMALIRDVATDTTKQTLVRTMVRMCRELNIAVIAEGVETADERDTLIDVGCDLLQGYFFGRPGRALPVPTFLPSVTAAAM